MSAGLSTAAIVGIGGAVAGGIGGALGKSASQQLSLGLDPANAQETGYFNTAANQFGQLQGLVANGAGASDVSAATGASRSLADLLGQYAKTGGLPSQGDINTSNSLANSLFANQQTALNQSFTTQNQQANQLAARLGRSVDDPILQAKMRTGFMNQQAMLDANKGGWATQFSLGMPGQRLGYASQQNDVLGNLASQAMQNRTALLNLGSSLGQQERNFRLGSASKNVTGQQGGGFGDALTGAMGGLGTGLDMAGKVGGMFGSGGGIPKISEIPSSSSLTMPQFGSSQSSSIFGIGQPSRSFSSALPSIPSSSQVFQGQPNSFFGRPMPYGGASGSW